MTKPMTCPTCNVVMNHHAEKLVDPRTAEEAATLDMRMGGVIEEVHTCPGCGCMGSRKGE